MESVVDVLIVGAGPTGLTLAAELRAHGVSFRIVDRAPAAVHQSRALAIQARTLEVLARLGVSQALVAAGDPATVLLLHSTKRTTQVKLFGEGLDQTAYPFLLFLSQAETERILLGRLTDSGVEVERDVEVLHLTQSGIDVTCTARTARGQAQIGARYVVGCDGAHSVVRHGSGIGFCGTAFPQTFVIADLEADGLEAGRIHVYLSEAGMMFFFPLGSPATWRILAMAPQCDRAAEPTLESVQGLVQHYTHDTVVLHDPVWLTNFSVQSRRADQFRAGRVLLAGDAAHIHSPAGAQGMNTGIQDAVNLGWKLARVCGGLAAADLLDSYEQERLPVADSVLRMTNRAFRVATSSNPVLRYVRPRVVAVAAPLVLRLGVLRKVGFRAISQLGIRYRDSPLSVEGHRRLRRGPHAGDRLPDAPITVDGTRSTLHAELSPTQINLLLCGPVDSWTEQVSADEWPGVRIVRLNTTGGSGVWGDPTGLALRRLGLRTRDPVHYAVRPDGYIGYRAGGTDLTGFRAYLRAVHDAPPSHSTEPGRNPETTPDPGSSPG
ncbi:FAD-dependent monooxygenase [Occultella aeris]|uniref:FAD-dependent monooxygenase n=1 Tax=Occultella aeris TaxID=2761496 RepID=UPI0018D28556|nr:FAD-dependent monooxygenase [Occultella aeris]